MPKDNQKVTYTTSINSELAKKFRIYCNIKNLYQNEVLEDLITELLNKDKGLMENIERLIKKEGEGIGNTDK